jgi:hypothetical protein
MNELKDIKEYIFDSSKKWDDYKIFSNYENIDITKLNKFLEDKLETIPEEYRHTLTLVIEPDEPEDYGKRLPVDFKIFYVRPKTEAELEELEDFLKHRRIQQKKKDLSELKWLVKKYKKETLELI